jgi:hypothetical protein
VIALFAFAPFLVPRSAIAQSSAFASADAGSDSDAASAGADDAAPDSTMDRPAPSADYDLPADAATGSDAPATADASPPHDTTAEADDRVLEIPQVVNAKAYAANTAAAVADETGLGEAANQLAEDAEAEADGSTVAGGSPDSSSQQAAEADPSTAAAGDAQDYADQDDDGGGPVVVYAGPIYVPAYVAPVAPIANPLPQASVINNRQLPMYSALTYRTLPMYSALPAASGRYLTPGGGSRLWSSHLGQSFAFHGSMGGFAHGR